MGFYSKMDRTFNRIIPDSWIKAMFGRLPLHVNTDVPWVEYKKPFSESKIALISSAGVHLKDDVPFDMESRKGDSTYRVIPGDVDSSDLMVSHSHYDNKGAKKDINVVFPIDRMRELVERELIGSVAPNNFGFMGFIPNTTLLVEEYAPKVAEILREDGVDAVVLAPA